MLNNGESYLLKPIGVTHSMVNQIIERIKEALITKELKPGDFLPSEEILTQKFGVGKSSIREAIKMLQALGVVEVKRGQGTVVCESIKEDTINPLVFQLILSGGKTDDVIDLRMMYEPAYCRLAMERATKEDIDLIKDSVRRFEDIISRGVQTAQDDIEFHLAILHATHNPFVEMIGKTTLQLFKASIERSMVKIPETALYDHQKILDAFINKDEAALYKAVMDSFKGWESSLLSANSEEGSDVE